MDSNDNMASYFFWVNVAHTKPDAIALASRLNLDFPRGNVYGFKAGLMCVSEAPKSLSSNSLLLS
jgi:hypothetical protein